MTDDVPEHLRQLPEEAVAGVVAIIISEIPHMPYGLGLELAAFAHTRTVHDAGRLARALRNPYGHVGLAKEVEDLLVPKEGILAALANGERAP